MEKTPPAVSPPKKSASAAFTLVEVILALGIVAVAGGLLLTSLAQSVQSEGKSHARDAAIRLEDVVRLRLQETGFEQLYTTLQDDEPPIFYSYTYRADREKRREDLTPTPTTNLENATLASGFRQNDDPFFSSDLDAAEGDIFRLRLTPFLHDSSQPYQLPELEAYPEPALRIYVEVFHDFTPGQNEGTWIEQRKVLAFPVSLIR